MENLRLNVHTPRLLAETLATPGTEILRIPLLQLDSILLEVAVRCSQLNDPVLNDLMCRLTLYPISDPESSMFDRTKIDEIESITDDYRK